MEDEVPLKCQGITRGYPMQSYRAEGYGRISPLLFLTRYLDIQPPGELCLTTFPGNFSQSSNVQGSII
jgi:hypothetical protein